MSKILSGIQGVFNTVTGALIGLSGLEYPGGAMMPVGSVPSDLGINYVVSGYALSATGATASAAITAGVAYIGNERVTLIAQALTLTALRDNYVDLSSDGLTITPVTVGAAAPALASGALRLGFVTTGVSTITSATQTGKDSLGNWMKNAARFPSCILSAAINNGFVAPSALSFGVGSEVLDNDACHSTVTNPTRLTIKTAGVYRIAGWCNWLAVQGINQLAITKNGAALDGCPIVYFVGNTTTTSAQVSFDWYFSAGDYLELRIDTGNAFIYAAYLSAIRAA